jgi:glycosyltransferase involved in cell wall biosynthesis
MNVPGLTAIVLTHNEAPNIRACLGSIQGLCPVHVVDSGSTDATLDICRDYTPHVHHHAYENHARQWAWALAHLPMDSEWVLALDADFTVTPQLAARLRDRLAAVPADVGGIYVRHLYVFGGSLIRHGGTKQSWMRLIRRGRAQPDESDLVDFRFVTEGRVEQWPEAVVEYNRHDDDISVWLRKQDKFSLRLAVEEELRRCGTHRWQIRPRLFGHADQRFAWLRDRWLRMPLFLRPVLYFVYRYLLAGGFLDGGGGFLYHALQGFWLRLMVDWKIDQLRRQRLAEADLRALSTLMLQSASGSVDELLARWRGAA